MSLSPSQRTQFLSLLRDIETCPTEELRKAAARLRFIREIREYRNSERFLNIAVHRELFDREEAASTAPGPDAGGTTVPASTAPGPSPKLVDNLLLLPIDTCDIT